MRREDIWCLTKRKKHSVNSIFLIFMEVFFIVSRYTYLNFVRFWKYLYTVYFSVRLLLTRSRYWRMSNACVFMVAPNKLTSA
jgi:hypothetical protein